MSKIGSFLSPIDLHKVFHAFIFSRLDYCTALYDGISQSSLHRLQLQQNAAARILTGTKKYDHITPALANLHCRPVLFRIEFKMLLITFKVLNGLAPNYIKDLLTPYTCRMSSVGCS